MSGEVDGACSLSAVKVTKVVTLLSDLESKIKAEGEAEAKVDSRVLSCMAQHGHSCGARTRGRKLR
eukprot:696028-Amphidinium_carterae.2